MKKYKIYAIGLALSLFIASCLTEQSTRISEPLQKTKLPCPTIKVPYDAEEWHIALQKVRQSLTEEGNKHFDDYQEMIANDYNAILEVYRKLEELADCEAIKENEKDGNK